MTAQTSQTPQIPLSQKERLLKTLRKESVDRQPVICMGGMMNAAVVEVMRKTGHTLPAAHADSDRMADLAEDVRMQTGFENFGIPFCMTVEAELLGADIDLGTLECEPKIAKENFPSVEAVELREVEAMVHSGRINVVVEAARRIARDNPDTPVIASLTGPVSTAASIVDPITFYKELRRNPDAAARVLDYVSELLAAFAARLADAGVAAIAVADPSATGEILGPKMFEAYALRYNNLFADRVHALGLPFVLHICGDLRTVNPLLPQLRSDALSTDAMVSLPNIKREFPSITTMGNLSTFALEWDDEDKIRLMTRKLVDGGIDIISPACGLSTSTRLAAIKAMTDEVKGK
ncbi:MAG: methylcobamide--CoM methyltransferase [Acidobacteriota bacterium]|jgi:[methyl-Co(III) methanol-specific corrinoid protein]:coenzyme M methyltransferase|nr:methylcobamide--CoM methyltransferase [Acidobacteriota bacterium]